jgi:hypothetical protein
MIQKSFLNSMVDPVLSCCSFILNTCQIQLLKNFSKKVHCLILRHLFDVDRALWIWTLDQFLIGYWSHLLVISFSSLWLWVNVLSILIELRLFSDIFLELPIVLRINILLVGLILELIITAKCILVLILCSYHFYGVW